jgi:hypothetical protein
MREIVTPVTMYIEKNMNLTNMVLSTLIHSSSPSLANHMTLQTPATIHLLCRHLLLLSLLFLIRRDARLKLVGAHASTFVSAHPLPHIVNVLRI